LREILLLCLRAKYMKILISLPIFCLVAVLIWLAAAPSVEAGAFRQIDDSTCNLLGLRCQAGGGDPAQGIIEIIQNIVNIFLTIVAIIAAVFIIIGGLWYITSAGDEEKAARGKRTILYAIIGLIIVGLSAVIVNFTIGVFGGAAGGGDVSLAPLVARAAFGDTEVEFEGLPQGSDLRGEIITIINYFLVLVSIVALIVIIIGGVRYIASRGDDTATASAKKTILYAVIGLLVIGLAAAIVNFVIGAF
ncbi:MAG: hypothetical protein ACRD4B_03455, partial [Acidobacteriota bacterium]